MTGRGNGRMSGRTGFSGASAPTLRLLAGLSVSTLVLGATLPASAQTEAARYAVDVPAQPLGPALRLLASQTGLQIAFDSGAVDGLSAPAVSGNLTRGDAVARMLAGSGLSWRFSGADTLTVVGDAATAGTEAAAEGAVVLDTIVLTASGERSGAVNQVDVTAQDLERRNPSDLADVFAGEPKVQVGSSIPTSQKLYVQGVEETNLAVTIDGGRQNNKIFHHNATNLIDPSLLKAVRVDAGVAPADAGPGALAGSIAFETKDARDLLEPGKTIGGFGTVSYETNSNTIAGGLASYGAFHGFDYLAYLNLAQGDNFSAGNGKEISGSGTELISGLAKVALQADGGDRLEISYERVGDDALRPFRANIGDVGTGQPDRRYDLVRQNVVLTYTDETPEGLWDPKAVLAYGVTDLEVPEPWGSAGTTDSFNGKFENRFAFDMGSITAGVDFYADEAEYREPGYRVSEAARNVGLYAQARIEPFERTRISTGARVDHQWFEGTDGSDFENSGLSGNLSGEYDITEHLTAKAGWSHVWAGVPLAENFIMNPGWAYADGPDPVTSDNLTAGLVLRWKDFTFEGNVFRTDIDNARAPSYRGGPLISHDYRSQGFDLSARYDWDSGYARVKFARVDAELDGAVVDSYLGNYLGVPLGDMIGFEVAHTFADTGLTVGGTLEIALPYSDTYVEGVPAGDERRKLPGYEVLNLFAQYVPEAAPNVTLRAEVKNLFDETYSSRATYGQDYATVTPLLEPGRTFKLTATARF